MMNHRNLRPNGEQYGFYGEGWQNPPATYRAREFINNGVRHNETPGLGSNNKDQSDIIDAKPLSYRLPFPNSAPVAINHTGYGYSDEPKNTAAEYNSKKNMKTSSTTLNQPRSARATVGIKINNEVDEGHRYSPESKDQIEIIDAEPLYYRLPGPGAKITKFTNMARKGKGHVDQPKAKVVQQQSGFDHLQNNWKPFASNFEPQQSPPVVKISGGIKIKEMEDIFGQQNARVAQQQQSEFARKPNSSYDIASNFEAPPSATVVTPQRSTVQINDAVVQENYQVPVPNPSPVGDRSIKKDKLVNGRKRYGPSKKNQSVENRLADLEGMELLQDYLFEARRRGNGKYDYFYYHKALVLKLRSIPEVIDFNETGVSPSGKSLLRRVGLPPIFKEASYTSSSGRSVITIAKCRAQEEITTTTTSTAAATAAAAAAEVENSAATESLLAQSATRGEELAIVVYDPRKKPGNEYAEFEALPKDGHSNAQSSSSAAEPKAPKSAEKGSEKRKVDDEERTREKSDGTFGADETKKCKTAISSTGASP